MKLLLLFKLKVKKIFPWNKRDNHQLAVNARLADDYPAYSVVICQFIDRLKLILLFAVQYLTRRIKMRLFLSVSASILPASNQTQR